MKLLSCCVKRHPAGILLSVTFLLISSCRQTDKKPELNKLPPKVEYSYDCLAKKSKSKLGRFLEKADDMLNEAVQSDITVTDEEVTSFGGRFYAEMKKDSSIVVDTVDPVNNKLKSILQDLLRARVEPSAIKYSIYLLVDDETVNAYTVGGGIFVTTAMIKACRNDDQLYSIIGHEIGHNERGHIRLFIQQQKAATKYLDEWGEPILGLKKLLTMSFNQKKELEADYYGIDLAYRLGYNICSIKNFWDSLALKEEHNQLEDIFRSHPYSDLRSECLANHISKNFNQKCN